ncbi:heavy-metal-associated domain-containing protein [Aliarcobacter cibarius]|jgi:periplasmic mercuric ion binding protein|uniref:Heavy-metal-associated domain-containing protein n=1 Tax=Aliarcobacter cibarius TaxID=255507 RepID=A0A7L5JNY3_9BACT|nr:heavy metal-associated domain-containing protein [Aliarcobacter cibarius]QKJ26895.1 heavy-metal-associated domain-containing protein, putative mercuric reductase [Aliarcobacter cibarius]TLS97472.1 heavy-metal-associated domain-containing protein [Aliarcobacter cibarius]TLS98035.1 heavy-metal-associated domain-containing protein [Aliarcobacter cibarius]TLT03098.1 heavy-metal-associated domain-containing protein [Aliarcobacter cibarius]
MRFFLILFIFFNFAFSSNVSIFKVEGMHCPLCTTAVKKAISKLEGVEKVSVRLNTKEVSVIYNEKVKIEDILAAIKTTSYEGVEISTKSE